jgi:hypothetical protein
MNREATHVFRDPESFDDVIIFESSHRTLYKAKYKDRNNISMPEHYEPETISVIEFWKMIEELGTLERTDSYLDPSSIMNVERGWVIKEDGKRYFFYISYIGDRIYKSQAVGVVSAVKYSGSDQEV